MGQNLGFHNIKYTAHV